MGINWFYRLLFLSIMLNCSSGYANTVNSEAFVVSVYNNYISVKSPPKYLSPIGVIVENKTITKLVGKVETKKEVLKFVSVEPNSFASVMINMDSKEPVYFVPMAPAFQEVELRPGKEQYEIPPQK